MSSTIDFYFDLVCPYAYLASLSVDAMAARAGASLRYKPVLLGGVFRAIGAADNPARLMPEPKQRYGAVDLARWAERAGVALRFPENHPRRTVLALRALLATGEIERATRVLYAAYWQRGEDLEDPTVVRAALDGAGLDGAAAVERAGSPEIKQALIGRTDEAVKAGVFGVPAFVVNGQLFWGQDRMDFVELAARAREPAHRFYFDYASPFAYLGLTQLASVELRTASHFTLEPILLGGLFRSIGTPDVPLLEMSEPKRLYVGKELDRWAARFGVPFRFPSRFPMRTITPLRMTLALRDEPARRSLALAIARAYWAEDRDISNEDELAAIAGTVPGVDGKALVELAKGDAAKAALRDRTAAAERRGIFGVPTFEVRRPLREGTEDVTKPEDLYWGADRIELVVAALKKSSEAPQIV
ncbi:MAG: 2-hydroxychromene-2-carboxylate isomerase [Polyangiaceae bacterium]